MNIDAKNLLLGRVASFAAKQVLLGEKVNIVNCELAVISGKKNNILKRYEAKIQRGDPHHGPFFPRTPKHLVRRTIRGMLPWGQARGREAYKRLKCFTGIPERFQNEKFEDIKDINVKKIRDTSYISVKRLCEDLK